LATEYDNVKPSIQTTKKEVMETTKSLKEVEVKIKSADDRIYDQDTRMDNIEQYLRRRAVRRIFCQGGAHRQWGTNNYI
jgi:septal ring factor EnvC (AmiA/AmiB activator)